VKVLLYSHDWLPDFGGVQTIVLGLARGLVASPSANGQGPVQVTVVTQTAATSDWDSQFPFRVIRRPGLAALAREIRSSDVVHVANPALKPLLLSWLMRKPFVIEHDGYQAVCPNGLLIYEPDRSVCPGHFMAGRYNRCVSCNAARRGSAGAAKDLLLTVLRRWLAKQAAVNIAPTRHVGARVQLPRTLMIHHGVPVPAEGTDKPRAESGIVFAYVGRLVAEKGVPVFLQAAARLAAGGYQFRAVILGDGPMRAELEEMAQRLGIGHRTEFRGSVRAAEISAALGDALAVVMPSVWEDVAPLVTIEQMMQGRLVIASKIGGLGELVEGLGLSFPPGDAEALARCMRQVLEAPATARELAAAAKLTALEKFTEQDTVERHLQLYRRLAAPGRTMLSES